MKNRKEKQFRKVVRVKSAAWLWLHSDCAGAGFPEGKVHYLIKGGIIPPISSASLPRNPGELTEVVSIECFITEM